MIPKEPNDAQARNVTTGEWEGQQTAYRSDRLIVKLKAPAEESAKSVDEICADIAEAIPGGEQWTPSGSTGRMLYSVAPDADPAKVAAEISARDDVEYAEPDVIDTAQVVPTDTRYSEQWALPKVDAPTAWDLETGDANVIIGIIDSGISMSATGGLNHPDLDASRYQLGTDFVDGGTPRDLNGHGTHVAGIAAAEANNAQGVSGMNWGSDVYICRTLDAGGNGSSANFAAAVEEIVDVAVAAGKKTVINYSGGGAANQTKKDACKYASDRGMILCAAAGNDNGGPVIFPAAYSADYPGVICVGSTDDDDTVSSFSNVGPEVNVVAPGRDILSTMPTYAVGIPAALNYDELSGTSMATPLVTGLVALMWSRHPGFTNQKIRDCLQNTAKKLGGGSFDNAWGHGRVDAPRALRCGDLFTLFTPWTKFTLSTRTLFTLFTPWTKFTLNTPTRWTRFTPFTPITRFTFDPGDPFGGRGGPVIRPFVRFAGALLDPAELTLDRFETFAAVAEPLAAAGLQGIDQVAATEPAALADALGTPAEDAAALVGAAQDHLRQLASAA